MTIINQHFFLWGIGRTGFDCVNLNESARFKEAFLHFMCTLEVQLNCLHGVERFFNLRHGVSSINNTQLDDRNKHKSSKPDTSPSQRLGSVAVLEFGNIHPCYQSRASLLFFSLPKRNGRDNFDASVVTPCRKGICIFCHLQANKNNGNIMLNRVTDWLHVTVRLKIG